MNCQIRCGDMAEFLDVIAGLVARGITFKADATMLIVTTTGGH